MSFFARGIQATLVGQCFAATVATAIGNPAGSSVQIYISQDTTLQATRGTKPDSLLWGPQTHWNLGLTRFGTREEKPRVSLPYGINPRFIGYRLTPDGGVAIEAEDPLSKSSDSLLLTNNQIATIVENPDFFSIPLISDESEKSFWERMKENLLRAIRTHENRGEWPSLLP